MKPMAGGGVILGLLVWSGAMTLAQDRAPITNTSPRSSGKVADVIGTYCSTCHNGSMRSPTGALLDQFDPARILESPDIWSRAYRQLQAGAMPPMGAPRPDRAANDAVLAAIEQALAADAPPAVAATSDELATRLAALLWNGEPDAALREEARAGNLTDPSALEKQVQRMVADDRARAFVARFLFPWLELDTLERAEPDAKYFPEYDKSLRDAFARETELFLLSQLREDRDPIELWSADYTFLNEQLATHYAVAGITGPQFRRVAWSRPERLGLLGHGSIHMVTSRHQHGVDAAYTTPATRAKWIRLHFLGAPLPGTFPGAEPLDPALPITPQARTLPAQPCNNCHRNFFPLGYALENFDPLGRWRTHDQIGPVDASGAFVDGTSMNGAADLRRVLLQWPEAFRTSITEKLLIYSATGSVTAAATTDTLIEARRIRRAMPTPPRWSALIAAVVRTTRAPGP